MIPSPPPGGKPVAFYDTEAFPNYWLLKIRVQNGPVFSFSLQHGESFNQTQIHEIESLFALFLVVSFNGNYYDVPIICAALCGFTCEQLKWLSDEIIVNQRKPWELGLPSEWKPADHIDVMEVLPGTGSQKQYAGRIHCKTMLDLPYEPDTWLTEIQILKVDSYCENDLTVLEALYRSLQPQLEIRQRLGARFGADLRSKSDAQVGESVIKIRCEKILGQRIYKPAPDWNVRFRYEIPRFITFQSPVLNDVLARVRASIFQLGPSGHVEMPIQLEGLEIPIGRTVYKIGIGGLHSKDVSTVHRSDQAHVLRDNDVRGYYPRLILNSGKWPPALGPAFREAYGAIVSERDEAKAREKKLKEFGNTKDPAYVEGYAAYSENEGGKVASNGPFGKLGSIYSPLFAPEMLIDTTLTGQLSLLMLAEWHEIQSIPVVSANTDGLLIRCPRDKIAVSESIIAYWQKQTNLEMETKEFKVIYMRDVNNYIGIPVDETEEVKRKGEFARSGLIEKKNPDVEICSDAVAEFLSKGTPILYTIAACRDIRKFVTIQKVAGGAVKLWGEGPRKGTLVRDMTTTLEANGWRKNGRKWERGGMIADPTSAHQLCFQPQMPEVLGKVVRWYYGIRSPGPIVYNSNGNTVSLSYGAQPCMTLPDEFPSDIDYAWYLDNCSKMLKDVGYYNAQS